jgi:hypothetical protein
MSALDEVECMAREHAPPDCLPPASPQHCACAAFFFSLTLTLSHTLSTPSAHSLRCSAAAVCAGAA